MRGKKDSRCCPNFCGLLLPEPVRTRCAAKKVSPLPCLPLWTSQRSLQVKPEQLLLQLAARHSTLHSAQCTPHNTHSHLSPSLPPSLCDHNSSFTDAAFALLLLLLAFLPFFFFFFLLLLLAFFCCFCSASCRISSSAWERGGRGGSQQPGFRSTEQPGSTSTTTSHHTPLLYVLLHTHVPA